MTTLFQSSKSRTKTSVMENEQESQAGEYKSEVAELKLLQLVLASSSPRRARILQSVGWQFEAMPVDIDETPKPGEEAIAYVERLSREKAEARSRLSPESVVLGADTTVVIDGAVLGKPRDEDEAREMLTRLSGRWHEVITGLTLCRGGENGTPLVAHESTRVLFATMSADEIDWYVSTGEPMDKAGAYAIQGKAALFIEKIEGDYWNIVGLPMQLLFNMARQFF